jgi:hypothetical protein
MVSMIAKKEYIDTVRRRYKNTRSKHEKSSIINEVCANLGTSRKHVIKIVNGKFYRKKRRKHVTRPVIYHYHLHVPLRKIWEVLGMPCSKKLKPQIPELIKKLEQFDEIQLYDEDKKLLCKMSTDTIDKLLNLTRKKLRGKGISGTKRSPLLKTLIPIRTTFDDVNEPGHVEQDCVLHCGESTAGTFAETLNTLDIETHWNEQTAFLKKTKTKVIGAFHEQRKRFPFPIKSIDFDNGFEFVNWAMYDYCKKEKIDFTRSRSYRKNDQAHIEGKNNESIRKVIGYYRIEEQEIVDLVNDIYQNEYRLLNNFFYPTMKLESKVRKKGKIIKKYGEAKTPYQRVIESMKVNIKVKMKLMQEYQKLNPAELQRNLTIKLKALRKKVSVSKINLASTLEN